MYLDILVILIMFVSVVFGIKNGFVVEFISTFGVIINFVISQKITPVVIEYVEKYLGSYNYTYTYIIIFILVFILFSFLLNILNVILKRQRVFFISRILGGILSLIKGVVISALVLLIFNVTTETFPKLEEYGEGSIANDYFLEITTNADDYVPEFFKESLKTVRDNQTIDKYIDNLF